jgi:predicted Zn-dependent protease
MRADTRAAVFRAAIDATEGAGLVGAGDAAFELRARAIMNTAGLSAYTSGTYAEFSLTARTKNGLGSGWAWSGYEDWSRVNAATVVASAVDLAQRSADPVGIEPGRYTVILEPAAVAALIEGILQWWDARFADGGATIYAKDPLGTNKIGLQMMDQRLWLVADPWDPDKPTSPIGRYGESYTKVVWFERGVLQNLEYDPYYAKAKGRETVLDPGGARLYAEGPTQSLEEMIASTRRGLWVSRLSGVFLMNLRTMLFTGTTRDGTFLIENGKITKAVKNFRFTESPFFVLNKLEAGGEPVRASRNIVAPRLKLRDFDFTSLTDAV